MCQHAVNTWTKHRASHFPSVVLLIAGVSPAFLKKAARDHRVQTLSWEVGSQFEPGSADPRLCCDCSASCLLELLKPGYLNLYRSIHWSLLI